MRRLVARSGGDPRRLGIMVQCAGHLDFRIGQPEGLAQHARHPVIPRVCQHSDENERAGFRIRPDDTRLGQPGISSPALGKPQDDMLAIAVESGRTAQLFQIAMRGEIHPFEPARSAHGDGELFCRCRIGREHSASKGHHHRRPRVIAHIMFDPVFGEVTGHAVEQVGHQRGCPCELRGFEWPRHAPVLGLDARAPGRDQFIKRCRVREQAIGGLDDRQLVCAEHRHGSIVPC